MLHYGASSNLLAALGAAWRRRWVRRCTYAGGGFWLAFLLADALFPAPYHKIMFSQRVVAADGTLLHVFLTPDDKWRLRTRVADVPPLLVKAFLYKEDRWFYWHPGINPVSVVRALLANAFTGRRTSGASTLTMQVARLLEPGRRTYARKLREMFRALQLEWHLSKREILELYLSLAPYGGNVEGVQAAALRYLGHTARGLSPAEAALLTVVPNQPTSLNPNLGQPQRIAQARDRWLKRYAYAGLLTPAELASALDEPVPAGVHTLPRQTGHLATRLRAQHPSKELLQTHISPEIHARTEQLVSHYVQQVRPLGISQAAALAIENRTGRVLAYVGSATGMTEAYQGYIDGVRARRSPGSTLKPLLYALAMDDGLITPQTQLLDVPVNHAGYQPENYDGTFRGPVTASEALELSLNIPAVNLLNEVGLPRFIAVLRKADFSAIAERENEMGLSLALGGCEVSLEELVGLFSALARGGKYRPLQSMVYDGVTQNETELVSEGAAYLVTDILQRITRPDLPNGYGNASTLPHLAWKTGTSYGRKDAWSIGYNKDYTVGVWLGNYPGQGSAALSGAEVATPLLFELFTALSPGSRGEWFSMPASVGRRSVCAITGHIPADYCTERVSDYYLQGLSHATVCNHLRWEWHDGKYSYCDRCKAQVQRTLLKGQVRDLSPDHVAFLRRRGMPLPGFPHNPTCGFTDTYREIRITHPSNGAEYLLDRMGRKQLSLKASAPADAQRLHWFVNSRYMGSVVPGESFFFQPDTGMIRVACTDDRGRKQEVHCRVVLF